MVTVAFPPGVSCTKRFAIGLPTMLERPTITAWAPLVSIPARINICWHPDGVAGRNAA